MTVSGFSIGNQLLEICSYSSIPIAILSLPNAALSYLVSSLSSILTFNIVLLEVEYGKLDRRKGKFKSAGALPGLYGLHIFTLNNDRLLYQVSSASNYCASREPNKMIKIPNAITFPTQFLGYCS